MTGAPRHAPPSTEQAPVVVLDLRGVPCPLSWARARVRLETLARGTPVVILLDEPRGVRDLPRAAESVGYHLIGVEEVETGTGWRIRLEV